MSGRDHRTRDDASASVSVTSLSTSYEGERVLEDVDLDVSPGEFCAVLGPSGSGKSVLLKSIAGLTTYTGSVEIADEDVGDVAVDDRDLGLVFQEFEETLFPHMTVEENVAFGLEQQDVDAEEIARRVDEVLELLAIAEIRGDSPEEISGGQQQRVELARQIVRDCRLLLLDDPLADLDYKLQKRMELELRRIHRESGATYVYVTHNQDQALKLADTVVVLNRGRVEQVGSPDDVYYDPANAFVGRFVGDSNMYVGEAVDDGVDTDLGVMEAEGVDAEGRVVVLVRPEDVRTEEDAETCDNSYVGTVEGRSFTGETTEYAVAVNDVEVRLLEPGNASLPEQVRVGWDAEDTHAFHDVSVDPDVSVEDLRRV